MGRARDKWKSMTVQKDGEILTVYLHPPGSFRNPNFWAWTCKKVGVNGRSLKVGTFAEAKERVFAWFQGEPLREEKASQERTILGWGDWDAIQVAHTARRAEKDRTRAERTLQECRKAQRLFVAVTGAESASSVDADMVGRFQLECPKRLRGLKEGNSPVSCSLYTRRPRSLRRCGPNPR